MIFFEGGREGGEGGKEGRREGRRLILRCGDENSELVSRTVNFNPHTREQTPVTNLKKLLNVVN